MGNNCKPQSLARRRFSGLPGPLGQGRHADSFSVAHVRPRTSKGITDLLLLNLVRLETACPSKKKSLYADSKNRARQGASPKPAGLCDVKIRLVSRLESRSLSKLIRQIAPPTKNGHAPPPTESRKSSQSVNPSGVRAW